MKGVIALYRRHPESPYHDVKANTRRMYDESLDLLEKTVGARVIGRLTGIDIKRWHGNLKKPAKAGGPERVRRAYKAMQLLRIAMTFGAVCGHEECERLSSILGKMRFEQPKRREKFVSYQQSTAIIEEALSRGLHSVALGQALQFELTLRQSEVIGSWEEDDGAGGGIVHLGRKWGDGLTWGHIDASGILNKETTKRGVKALHNVLASPVLMRLIDMVPQEKRIGPMIICETTGRPYRYRHWAGTWRKIANAVGVPADVWNRDSRAGGITEGFDAGADLETMRQHASHTDAAMTSHYNRLTVLKTEKVAKLRQAHRKKDE
ncbi:MAG: site-specific integrase [Pseudomonadota bacterium]